MNRVHAIGTPLLCLLTISTLTAQQPASSVELPTHSFAIKQSWVIGGSGTWDYLTMDTQAKRLYIAHGHSVQVVDVTAGTVVGEIGGLGEAHCIALNDTGDFGYVSDGIGGKVVVFDRQTFKKVATINDIPNVRALVFETQTKLLFAVRTDPVKASPTPRQPLTTRHITPRPAAPPPLPPAEPHAASSVTVIDPQTNTVRGRILLSGRLGFAQADSRGRVYVAVTDRNQVASFDAQIVDTMLPSKQPPPASASNRAAPGGATKAAPITSIDWTDDHPAHVRSLSIGRDCSDPRGLAVDAEHTRLFIACSSMKLAVLNAQNGDSVSTLPIGPGVDSIAYDPNHNLIYAANGGLDGTLTVIHQDVTDSYAVLQNLPTRQRARSLAVDSDTGMVYLVTDMLGVELGTPGGIGSLTTNPVNGSFSVLVVGN